MAKATGRSSTKAGNTQRLHESEHSHVEFGSTRGRWDRDAGSEFAITTVNVPDRLDAQEVRARASADAGQPSVRRFHRADLIRGAGWLIAVTVVGAIAWGAVRVAGPLRAAISPAGIETRVSRALGMPVSVRETGLRLSPSPRLVVTDLIAQNGLRLPEIAVHFNWRDALRGLQTSTWVLGEARVAPVALTGQQALALLQSVRRASELSAAISTVRFESVTFSDLVLLPGHYEAVIRRGVSQREFEAINLKRLDAAGQMELEIKPSTASEGAAKVALFASPWRAAFGPAIAWSEATAQGEFNAERLKIDSFSVGSQFGNLTGAAVLAKEGRGWRLTGNVRSADVSLEALIRHLTAPRAAAEGAQSPTLFQGTARFDLALAGAAATVTETLRGATARGPVSVSGATLSGVNLGLAATQGGAPGAGGTTRLTDLELEALGSLDGLAISGIAGRAGSLRVHGGFTVDRELRLRGSLRSEVASPRGVSGAEVRLGGTVAAPTYQ